MDWHIHPQEGKCYEDGYGTVYGPMRLIPEDRRQKPEAAWECEQTGRVFTNDGAPCGITNPSCYLYRETERVIQQTINWIKISDRYPPSTGTYLAAIRCRDGKLRSHIGLFVHPKTSPYKGLDWRDLPYGSHEVEYWAALPKLEDILHEQETGPGQV